MTIWCAEISCFKFQIDCLVCRTIKMFRIKRLFWYAGLSCCLVSEGLSGVEDYHVV